MWLAQALPGLGLLAQVDKLVDVLASSGSSSTMFPAPTFLRQGLEEQSTENDLSGDTGTAKAAATTSTPPPTTTTTRLLMHRASVVPAPAPCSSDASESSGEADDADAYDKMRRPWTKTLPNREVDDAMAASGSDSDTQCCATSGDVVTRPRIQ